MEIVGYLQAARYIKHRVAPGSFTLSMAYRHDGLVAVEPAEQVDEAKQVVCMVSLPHSPAVLS